MSKTIKTKKDVAKALIGALIILFLIDLTPLSGNTVMYAKWLQCGHKPLHARLGAGMGVAGVPNYVTPPDVAFLRGYTPYFCTPYEAEKAGFSADEIYYEFPHLSDQEAQQAIKKSQGM